MTLSGPSTVARTRLGGRALRPNVLHLRPHQLPVSMQASHRYYFSGSTKFNLPLLVLEFHEALRATENGNCQKSRVRHHKYVIKTGFVHKFVEKEHENEHFTILYSC